MFKPQYVQSSCQLGSYQVLGKPKHTKFHTLL